MSKRQRELVLGGTYEHYKGKQYKVLHVAKHTETEDDLVIYHPVVAETQLWARPLSMFLEDVNSEAKMVPRFSLVNSDQKMTGENVIQKQELKEIPCTDELTLEDALKLFFDKQLLPGMAYGGKPDKTAHTSTPSDAILMYQDGTACSASYAMSDIFQLPDKSFLVQTDVGHAYFMGDNPSNHAEIVTKSCSTLLDVVVELAEFCFHDPNAIGDLLVDLYSSD